MKSLLELYGQQFRNNPMLNSDSQDYTTADVFGQMGANKRRSEYDNSLLGMVHNWATGEQRQPVQLPDNAPLMDQMKEAGMRMLNLPNDMAAGGAKTMAHWLGSAGNPEMVEPLDMLAPLGIGAIAWLDGAVPRGAVGSAGGKLANEALDMSHEARMQRAREMGFDTDTTWYHGTDADIKSFDNSMIGENYQDWSWGHHLTNDPSEAATYGSAIMPLFVKNDGTQFVQNSPGYNASQIADLDRGYLSGKAKTSGATSVRVIGKDGNENMVVLDPRNIRSVNAAFDPAKSDSANLLAADQARASLPGLLAGAADEPRGITAYHGSPHDFDRFSMDKIGTGEGAQAYGHGLYFAENEGVARNYKAALSKPESVRAFPSAEDAKQFGEPVPDGTGGFAAKLGDGSYVTDGAGGRMYEVRINADPEDFLDWDKPLSQQSKPVRDAVKELRPDEQTVRMISDLEAKEASGAGNYASRMLLARLKKRFGSHAVEQDVRGSSIMSDERAAALLRDSGIPGIRYLDQGSRGAGEGSRNYVLFRDDIIEIVKKYGIAAAASMYGMSQVQDAMASEGP